MITNAKIEILDLSNADPDHYNRYNLNDIVIKPYNCFFEYNVKSSIKNQTYTSKYDAPVIITSDGKIMLYEKLPNTDNVIIRLIEFNGNTINPPSYYEVKEKTPFPMFMAGGEISLNKIEKPVFK